MKTFETLKKAGIKFSRKNWPIIAVGQIRALGITPEALWAEFGHATLEQTPIGNRTRIGFMMKTGASSRPLYLKSDRVDYDKNR